MNLGMRRWAAILLALLFVGIAPLGCAGEPEAPPTLTVHFIALGRVDGIYLECGGENAFIDAGTHADGKKCVRYLKALGVESLTYYFGTHAHKDHVGGAARLIREFSPDTVYLPYSEVKKAIVSYAEDAKDKSAAKKANYAVLAAGDSLTLGSARIECLGPLKIEHNGFSSVSENNNSMILKVTLGERSFLLTADTREQILDAIDRKTPGVLEADVLKNPHHNADIPLATIARVSPIYVVFTTDGSHVPLKDYTAALEKNGVLLFSTAGDDAGHILFTTDGETIDVEVSRPTTAIRFKKTELSMDVGQKGRLNPILTPKKRYGALIWSSENEAVVRVSATGTVGAVAPGETVVRVACAANPDVYAQVSVRVKGAPAASPQPEAAPSELHGPVEMP